MDYLNIQITKDEVLTIGCDIEYPYIKFEHDIKINKWIVYRIVKIGGPRYSKYKYEDKNYLEFVLTDNYNKSLVVKYYYNGGYNENLGIRGCQLPPLEAIAYFVSKAAIFQCDNFNEI